MPRTVYYAAMSADGFIADAEGGVHWLEPYNDPALGYEGFLATVGGVVLGRATYDQSRGFGPWPYPGRKGLVVTSKPVTELPAGTEAVTPAALPEALRALRAQVANDVWIVGGGQTARACLDAGLVDELELYVVPVLLGRGIPLLAPGAPLELQLLDTRRFDNGLVMLRWAVRR